MEQAVVAEQATFNAWVPITKAGVDPKTGDLLVSGPVCPKSGGRDYDGEVLEKAGVWKGLEVHAKLGAQVDYDHMYTKTHDPKYLIGRGVDRVLVGDTPWLTTKLRTGTSEAAKLAKGVLEMIDDGMHVGYSIQGSGVRDPNDPTIITGTNITMVTIAPQPKGFLEQTLQRGGAPAGLVEIAKAICTGETCEDLGAWLPIFSYDEPVIKALVTGDGVVQIGDQGGRALRSQALMGTMPEVSNGGEKKKKRKSPLRRVLEGYADRQNDDDAGVEKAHGGETTMEKIKKDEERDHRDQHEDGGEGRYADREEDGSQDDGNDDGGEEEQGLQKAIDQLASTDELATIMEIIVLKAVEPLYAELDAIRSENATIKTDLAKALSASETINENLFELGDKHDILHKALGDTNADMHSALEKATSAVMASRDEQIEKAVEHTEIEERTAPARKVVTETVLDKAVSGNGAGTGAFSAEKLTELVKAAELKQAQTGEPIKALTDVIDAFNAGIDMAPYAANLEKALATV